MILPLDIIAHMFSWLQIKDICNFMRTCRRYWMAAKLINFRKDFAYVRVLRNKDLPEFIFQYIGAQAFVFIRPSPSIRELRNLHTLGRHDVLKKYNDLLSRGLKFQFNKIINFAYYKIR